MEKKLKNSKVIELNPWMHWISENIQPGKRPNLSTYDRLCELVVNSYELNKKDRRAPLKDMVQFFLWWWVNNKEYMNVYNTYDKVAGLLNMHHATVCHHVSKRKPTLNYEENVKCIRDFLMDTYD